MTTPLYKIMVYIFLKLFCSLGALFAVIYFLEAVCKLTAGSLFLYIYGQTQTFMRGFVYLVMAGIHTTSILIFM